MMTVKLPQPFICLSRNLFFLALVASLATSCSRKVSFLTSTVVPAAQGKVKIKRDDNKNFRIQMEIENLTQSDRLQPPRKAYVVWMTGDDNSVKNMGQVTTSSGLLSSKLEASFETVSPIRPKRIFITAEDDFAISYPGSQLVLTTDIF